jgi:hypothetical protein
MNHKEHRMIDQADLMVLNAIKYPINVLTRVKECLDVSCLS